MTDLLNQAFQQASSLSPQQQDALAAWLLSEIEDEAKWDTALAKNPSALDSLAAEARAELAAGRTEPLVPEEL